jgi:hypothetical protein
LHLHVWLVGFLPGTPSLRSLCCGDSSHLRKSRLNRSQTNQSRPLLLAATFISRLYASQKIMTNQSIHIYIYLHIRIQIYIYIYILYKYIHVWYMYCIMCVKVYMHIYKYKNVYIYPAHDVHVFMYICIVHGLLHWLNAE